MNRGIGRFLGALVVGLSLTLATTPARAQSGELGVASDSYATRRITMGVGKSVIIDLPSEAAEIFVGNPKVANAVVRSARKLYVIATDNGQTTIFAMDRQGRRIVTIEISVGRDVGELQQILRAAMPTNAIQARTVNDTIILTGTVDSTEDAQRAADIAKGFARQAGAGAGGGSEGLVVNSLVIRGRDQVMLKVTIAEIRRDVAKQLGVTSSVWSTFTQDNPFGIAGQLSATALKAYGGNGSVTATLQAFERYGVSRTLAEPTVTAVSGESAKFTVGGQFPYPSGLICPSSSTGSTTGCAVGGAAFKDYGITLNFSPVVLAEGRILLHLATEVTDIDNTRSVNIEGVPTPGLLTRKNEATIELPSGGSIATAGLLQTEMTQIINGMPGLMNLPILGALFRSRDYQRNETELMIIVTPYVVKPTTTAALTKPDDGFSDASDPQTWFLGRMNRLYATPNNPQALKNFRGRVGFIQD